MTSRARRWLIAGGGVVVLSVASMVALLVAPAFIDLNVYKAEIVNRVKRETGYDLAIDGPISLWLLPTPAVRADDVKVVNAAGAAPSTIVEIKSATMWPSLWALLVGQVEIAEARLIEPKALLEIDAQGRPNMQMPTTGTAASLEGLSLGRLTVEDGTLTFNDAQIGLSMSVEKANINATIASIDGPFSVSGGVTVNGSPLRIELDLGAKGPSGYAAGVALQAGGGRLSFKGTVSELGPAARLSGNASASADNLIAFVETLIKIADLPRPPLPPLLAGRFSFEGPVELSRRAVASKDFKLVLGDHGGIGSAAITLKPALDIDAKFAAKRLDLDRWLASIKLADQVPAPEPPAPLGSAATPAIAGPSLLLSTTAKLSLEAGELIYNKKPVRDIVVDLEARGGAVAVPRFNAVLPGDLTVKARSTMSGDAARPSVSGAFSLMGDKLRETLAWLDVDVASVPADKLSRVSMTGRLTSNSGNAEVKDAAFELDALKGTGGIVVAFTAPLAVVTHLEFDTLDLDSYLPPAGQKSSAGPESRTSAVPILALLGPMVGLKVKVAKVAFGGEAITGVELDVARERGTLKLNDLKIANLAGARLALRGNIAGYWEQQPRADIAFSFDAPDINRVLKLVDATQQGLGAVSASGSFAGTVEQLVLREVAVSAMGVSARATGSLALPGAAEGLPRSASYKGSITVNGQMIEGSVEASLTGKPNIVADLKAGMLDLDRTSAARPRHPTAPSQSIDTAPLRRADGTLRFSAAGVTSGPLRVANVEMMASLKDGIVTFSTLKGLLYGGSLNLSGTLNGTQSALSFDMQGDAKGMHVGELLRASSGTNVFGRIINVAIDGSLNADGIALRGRGVTVAEIKSSLAGGARVSGSIRASADRFLQILGSAATGAVGGAIDITLGSLMSLAGDKGGVDVANLLNAISLVLHRFVNHDNALSGQLDIAGGIVTVNGLVVQGGNATANVATQTNLANATTQTTINFVIAEDRSGPYLITTASGPLSALSFHATRGSAKDPPGIESMVPNVSHLLPKISVPHIPLPHIPNPFGR